MKQFITIFIFLAVVIPMAAQPTQSGYVKTKGRMDSKGQLIPGTRIGGAAITLAGGHSTVADANGNFTLTVPDKKFFLKNVQKQGYVLVDPEVLSKQYVQSANPLVITMETPQQQMRDQIEAQKRIEATLRKQLLQREQELEALKEAQKITEDEFYEKMQKLYDEKITENLVKEMSKRYSEIDYDLIDSFQRQFSTYILDGDLRRADSLLKTKGDLSDDVRELQQLKTANAAEREALERRRARLDTSIAYAQWLMEDIAMRCYNKSEIFKLRYMNDSAAYYLELRAGLDTTNVDWQLDVGLFIDDFLAKYDNALTYYQRALRQSSAQYGQNHPKIATCYNNIGTVYDAQGHYAEALEYHQKALTIRKSLYGENHQDVATTYNNMGMVYKVQGKYAQALEYYKKALSIRKSFYGESHPNVALCYNNIGTVYGAQGHYVQAMEYHKKALIIWKSIYGEKHPKVALSYNNIGMVYKDQGDYAQALEYHQKALAIRKSFFGENHPDVATSYNNVGSVYKDHEEYAHALEYYQRALSIMTLFFGENHPNVATIYSNIGTVYKDQGDYAHALEYIEKALAIKKSFYGEIHPDVATIYNNIGTVYYVQGNYTLALEYFQKVLTIRNSIYGESHPDVANIYKNIGTVYYAQKDFSNALVFFQKSYTIYRSLYGEENAISMRLIGVIKTTQLKIITFAPDSMKQYIFTATTVDGETPAKAQGLSGEYVVLEFGDWSIDSTSSLYDVNDEMKGKPKTILIMKDDKISQHYFENSIGVQFDLKQVGETEKNRIKELYHRWKMEH